MLSNISKRSQSNNAASQDDLDSLMLLGQFRPDVHLCLMVAQQQMCARHVAATPDEEQQQSASLLRQPAVNRSSAQCFRCITLALVLCNRGKRLLISKKFHAALSFVHSRKISVLHWLWSTQNFSTQTIFLC